MANPCFLLESKFSFNPLLPLRSPPITLSSGDNCAFKLKFNYSPYKVIRGYPKLRVTCFSSYTSHNKPKREKVVIGNGCGEWYYTPRFVTRGGNHNDLKAVSGVNGVETVVGVGPAVRVEQSTEVSTTAGAILLWGMVFGATLTVLARPLMIAATNKTSILQLQVGLSGMGKCESLQRDLNRIAARPYDKYETGGYVLQETALALLRHPQCCISGYSSVYMKRSIEEVEDRFNQICIFERGKFDVDTLVNVNNIGHVTTERSRDLCNEYMVITIIVAVEGGHKLPQIDNNAQLKEALGKLATLSLKRVQAVAVLLTPQNENDSHMEQNFLENYSYMCPL